MKTALLTLLVAAVLAVMAGAVFVRAGVYDVSATSSHTRLVFSLLETALAHSVRRRAAGIEPPPLDDADRLARGAACFRDHCVQCHGAPGVAQGEVGKSLEPLPGPLIDAARRWRPAEVYWITRHGIRMSGMPAWELRLSDEALWSVAAFVDQLASLSPADYGRRMAQVQSLACPTASEAVQACGGADCPLPPTADLQPVKARDADERARLALRQYACSACHVIPGVVGPDTHVGPPLEGLAGRQFIAGRLPTTRDNLERWIREPRRVDPATAMPDMGVTEAHARLMADYLLQRR